MLPPEALWLKEWDTVGSDYSWLQEHTVLHVLGQKLHTTKSDF